MRICAAYNNKGGVGKTTTTVNLAAALAAEGARVLAVDVDPQQNASWWLGVDEDDEQPTVLDVLRGADIEDAIRPSLIDGVDVLPSDLGLIDLDDGVSSDALRDGLASVSDTYDYCLIDCPPELGDRSIIALAVTREVIVCAEPAMMSMQGLGMLHDSVITMRRARNPALHISALVLCRAHDRTNAFSDTIEILRATDWGDLLCETYIRHTVRHVEAQGARQSILAYDPSSTGAEDYLALARELRGRS